MPWERGDREGGRWTACRRTDRRTGALGFFPSEGDAALTRDDAASAPFGACGWLNCLIGVEHEAVEGVGALSVVEPVP